MCLVAEIVAYFSSATVATFSAQVKKKERLQMWSFKADSLHMEILHNAAFLLIVFY